MPVNNFEFEKADGIISSIKGQSVGRDPISAAAIFNFVSIAQKGFGYEPEEDIDMLIIIYPDINGDWHIEGNFDKCLAQVKEQKPVLAVYCPSATLDTSGNALFAPLVAAEVLYDVDDPDQVTFRDSSVSGWNWTSEGLERFD